MDVPILTIYSADGDENNGIFSVNFKKCFTKVNSVTRNKPRYQMM